jgi:hypothetical protein
VEEKNPNPYLSLKASIYLLKNPVFWIGLFSAIHLAVLPMASTTALSNLSLAGVLLGLIFYFRRSDWVWPAWPLLAWAFYICLFPLISETTDIAFINLKGQWIKSLYAMLAGAGVAAVLANTNKGTALHLGMISTFILLIHLSLFGYKAWDTQSIPWKYWGIEVHHADLGYAAGQAVILLTAWIFAARGGLKALALVLILCCFTSMALAESRAGLVFGFLGMIIVAVTNVVFGNKVRINFLLAGFLSLCFIGLIALAVSFKVDARWQKILPALEVGFLGNAIELECEGLTSIESQVKAKFGDGISGKAVMDSLRDADAQRIVLARAGLELAANHPWGLDGSRQAFQKRLRQKCPDPVLKMSHTHNGWIDTMLAIGWLGAFLYAMLLMFFFKLGVAEMKATKQVNEWALVLVALSIFWLLRGFTDSVFRDHMLQMQGFVLAFAAVAMHKQKQEKTS